MDDIKYCNCTGEDMIFRGKIAVERDDDHCSLNVTFCDVTLTDRETGEVYKCYQHRDNVMFHLGNIYKYMKFLAFIVKCANLEANFGPNRGRMAQDIDEKMARQRKMIADTQKKKKQKEEEETQRQAEERFNCLSLTEWPELC